MATNSPSAAAVLGPYVATQIAAIRRHDPVARAGDADAIHDMRVAVRRLKAVLAVYRPAFDPVTGRPLRKELDWLAQTLGHARDHEVQRLIWRDLTPDDDSAAQVDLADRAMAEEAQAALSAELASARYLGLAEQLRTFDTHPPWTTAAHQSPHDVLIASLSEQFARMESRVDLAEAASSPTKVDARLHGVRKSVKRARYATEACEPLLEGKAADLAHELSLAQEALGDHNDLVDTRSNVHTWVDFGVTAINDDTLKLLKARARKSRKQARQALASVRQLAAVGQSLPR